MKTRFRCIGLALAAALSMAAARDSSGGYLATVGPAALRFRALVPPAPILPPLDSGGKPEDSLVADSPAVTGVEAKTQEPPGVAEKADEAGALSEIAANSTYQVPLISPEPEGPISGKDFGITSQMFLRFFAQTTNSNHESTVVVPLSFTPAQPAERPSSSARYSSPKQ